MQATPRSRRTPHNTQYTYFLGRRVYDVKTYPVRSPQGATILLHGHENGVTVTWRGGKRLKPPKPSSNEKRNGNAAQDAVMVIDSDDDEATAATPATFVDKPEFQDTTAADASSLPEIVQTLDLVLGTAVLGVAVLPLPHCAAEDAASHGASILKDKMVFAITCSSNNVYVITLPLTPPSHESKARPELRQSLLAGNAGKGMWGETLALLGGQSRPCGGVAIALVKPKTAPRSRSLERTTMQASQTPRVIVAAHSREASGTLRFWDVSLDAKPGVVDRVEPFQTEYLPSPLTGISFNPTHVSQLLAITSSHAVRVYDYSAASLPSEDTSEGPFPSQGSWLLTLYPPFTRGSAMSTARKPIVAADWISHGRAVLVLFADGQWGIWDIDGGSPAATGASSGSLFSKASAGLRGSAITSFSISGHLEGTSPLRNPGGQKTSSAAGTSGEFVAMAPHTRRDAIGSAIGALDKLSTVRGGITVTQLSSKGAGPADEGVVLWLGGADPIVSVVPSMSKFWDSQLRRAGGGVNLWSGPQPTRMTRLTDLSAGLLGERCTGAVAIPRSGGNTSSSQNPAPAAENGASEAETLTVEVLLQGETRMVIVHESEEAAATSFNARLLGGRKKARLELGPANAILAYPRPERPNSVAFNLSIAHQPTAGGAGLLRPNRPQINAVGSFASTDVLPSTEAHDEGSFSQQTPGVGLRFVNDLDFAADQPDDEAEAENRNIEEEMMDIMEIDRVMEQMESERERSTKRVFFEEG